MKTASREPSSTRKQNTASTRKHDTTFTSTTLIGSRKNVLFILAVGVFFFFLLASHVLTAEDQQLAADQQVKGQQLNNLQVKDLQAEMEMLYPKNTNFSQDNYQKLLDGETLIEVHTRKADGDDLKLLMDTSFTESIHEIIDDVRPNNLVETLTILPYSIHDPAVAQAVYNAFLEVSDLTAARYYSQKKDGLHPVFHESYRVASPDNLDPLPDPQVQAASRIPETSSMLIHQNPSSLIPVTSRIDYNYRDGQIYVEIDNLTDIRFHFLEFVRLVKPHNMKTIAVVLPLKNASASLLYLLGGADTFSFFGLGSDKSEELIYNRTIGMINFYTDKLNNLEFQVEDN